MADIKGMTYVRMMLDVLGKKEAHLSRLLEYTKDQEKLLKSRDFDDQAFSELVEKKADLLKRLEEFDKGFQSIYNRVEEELKEHKYDYKEQVLEMQELISKITDLGVKLSALEKKNRAALELKLQEKKQGIKQFKVSKQTANQYYRNMMGLQTGTSYFMDQKK